MVILGFRGDPDAHRLLLIIAMALYHFLYLFRIKLNDMFITFRILDDGASECDPKEI